LSIRHRLAYDEYPQQHDLTVLFAGKLEMRDKFTHIFAFVGNDLIHNQLMKAKLAGHKRTGETPVAARFDKDRDIVAVVSITQPERGFPSRNSEVVLRDFISGETTKFSMADYLRRGPDRPYRFDAPVPPDLIK